LDRVSENIIQYLNTGSSTRLSKWLEEKGILSTIRCEVCGAIYKHGGPGCGTEFVNRSFCNYCTRYKI